MADITKCSSVDCPYKEHCYRFTAVASSYQSWFTEPPLRDGMCDEYWGDLETYIKIKLQQAEE